MRAFTLLITLFLFACNSHRDMPRSANHADTQNSTAVVDTQKIQPADSTLKDRMRNTVINEPTLLYIWVVDFDKKTKTKNPYLKTQYQHVDSIIKGLNESNPGIKLEKLKISADTLYTEINNSEYLGEQMGSSGAEAYFAEAIINLTSIKGIKYVKIDFQERSHASPDVWSRGDFKDYKEIH